MATSMQALQSFFGPDGNHDKDTVFEIESAERVKFLTEGGYAQKVNKAEAAELAKANPVVELGAPGR